MVFGLVLVYVYNRIVYVCTHTHTILILMAIVFFLLSFSSNPLLILSYDHKNPEAPWYPL